MSSSAKQAKRREIWRDFWIGLGFVTIAVLIPLFDPGNYVLSQITLFFIWAAVVTQWNLVFGVAGVYSLAHMAVFAVGGYATGMMGLYAGWNLWAALPIGALAAVIASLLIGAANLRLRGPYVAIMTLAIAQVMYSLIITDVECFIYQGRLCLNFTGGSKGLIQYGDFGFRDLLGFKYRIWGDYYLSLVLLILGMLFSLFIIYGPLGATFRALRDNQICAEARGVDRVRSQLLVFALSGIFTGLAGGVYAGVQRTIGPDMLSTTLLLFLLSMMVVGGRGTKWGPILGAGALMLVDTTLRDFGQIRVAGLSLIILLVMIFLPRGLVGLVDDIFRWRPRSRWEDGAEGGEERFDFREYQRLRNPKKTPFGTARNNG
ncbi:branched-chain amino acid ABC transporter permease [Roseobacter weihaiensis]|uniref:branched-chain amino acid ABC transporter permease n=1 Tax=Roseobacter weihaiensis TaxID=2763262 RepID=UPI001D0AEEA0|nr:branched-chain amino acid ABC transporter permease [Roseobacter sp. H9]